MRDHRRYMGMGFDVWNGERTWFWSSIDPRRNCGTIGAAATQAEAVLEACRSIEEAVARRFGGHSSILRPIGWRTAVGRSVKITQVV